MLKNFNLIYSISIDINSDEINYLAENIFDLLKSYNFYKYYYKRLEFITK